MADPTEQQPTPKLPPLPKRVPPTPDNPWGDPGIERFDEDPMVTLINGRPPTPFPIGDETDTARPDETD
jgi:hypothetical protein